MRIGHGYDVHRFCHGDQVIIGGVAIPHNQSLEAHSDGDVLIHALCDALLGAAAMGDIGKHFPDTDPNYSGVDSRELLRHVCQLLANKGFVLGNADMTIVAQTPKMSPHIEMMRRCLAEDLNTEIENINVKATTTEKLGFAGRKEGIAAHSVVLINKVSRHG
ncbi:2-C-methyl-D-erythritol 2,4-cyclodiphosphate synthase [Sinobacterium norvegicum]|nr:2-C-methyl-D-erythritol 2,4-cyclodiphosphate synthase [Sinobacterium norvegicum]